MVTINWNDPIYKIGIRARALGLKTWLSFVRQKEFRLGDIDAVADHLVECIPPVTKAK